MVLGDNGVGADRVTASRIAKSLHRLQASREQTRQADSTAEKQFLAWQEKWSGRREQISQRLSLIDAQLERLVPNTDRDRPQFSVVGQSGE